MDKKKGPPFPTLGHHKITLMLKLNEHHNLMNNTTVVGLFLVKVGWAASCGIGPEYSKYGS